ncbi:MAG: ATP-binding cassette domain-containing protein [Acidimicrobiia bacterium]|nr:ATP-binding cassette domain-containing protein [Acidimicrobiia bacterium]
MDAISTEGLVRTFGDVQAVGGVDLAVRKGEIYGFLGPNGAGKSTTVRMLCTLLRPSAGTMHVVGKDVVAEPEEVRLRIGVALQSAALDPKQTGRELLTLQARLFGLSSRETTARVRELTDLTGLGDSMDRRIGTYSGGMKRRLDLAAALVHRPEVLFLDEPTTGLDPESRNRVWSEVRSLNEAGMTVFLTTQYLEEADALADRVGIISHGAIVAEGPPATLKKSMGADVVVVRVNGEPGRAVDEVRALDEVEDVEWRAGELTASVRHGAAAVSPIALALAAHAVEVTEMTLRTPTLDDVFLHLTGTHLTEDESGGAGEGSEG